jgi:hypothetical protein
MQRGCDADCGVDAPEVEDEAVDGEGDVEIQ